MSAFRHSLPFDGPAAARLAENAGLGRIGALTPLAGGANNRVFRADTDGGTAVLKFYFHHPADPRDRLGAEYGFLTLAWNGGIRCIPQPLAADAEHHLALYGFVAGSAAPTVTGPLVDQALAFIAELQGIRGSAGHLRPGSEACFSPADHLATVEHRLTRLAAIAADTPLHAAAARLVRDKALPHWQAVAAAVRATAAADPPLDDAGRCLSPSDFGFHNALVGADGRAVFLDFEYAGWDDPAKLVGDFLHQPAVPVPVELYPGFRDRVAALFPDPEGVVRRCDALRPVYGLKWVAILLNDFLPTGAGRRAFSRNGETAAEAEARRARQLAKAREAMARLAPIPLTRHKDRP